MNTNRSYVVRDVSVCISHSAQNRTNATEKQIAIEVELVKLTFPKHQKLQIHDLFCVCTVQNHVKHQQINFEIAVKGLAPIFPVNAKGCCVNVFLIFNMFYTLTRNSCCLKLVVYSKSLVAGLACKLKETRWRCLLSFAKN